MTRSILQPLMFGPVPVSRQNWMSGVPAISVTDIDIHILSGVSAHEEHILYPNTVALRFHRHSIKELARRWLRSSYTWS